MRLGLAVLCVTASLPLGCVNGSGALFDAGLMTAIALSASAQSRASGGCYAACPAGTACNPATGYCHPLPCRGLCAGDELCVAAATGEGCVRMSPVDLQIGKDRDQPPPAPDRSDVPLSL